MRFSGPGWSAVFFSFGLYFCAPAAQAESAYVRVSQVGYESSASARAYLMSTAAETGARFKVVSAGGSTAYTGKIGAPPWHLGKSKNLTYQVYALDFTVPAGPSYSISVSGPVSAQSPAFAVDLPEVLYPGLLVNTLFFYQTQRDGPEIIPNALRTAPGHLKDKNAVLTVTPPLDDNDFINNVPPAKPLSPANLPNIAADGGRRDAGDYEKYVETVSYTTALMEIGGLGFPTRWGRVRRAILLPLPIRSHTRAIVVPEHRHPRTSAPRQRSASSGS